LGMGLVAAGFYFTSENGSDGVDQGRLWGCELAFISLQEMVAPAPTWGVGLVGGGGFYFTGSKHKPAVFVQ